jgi:hypothetical protein
MVVDQLEAIQNECPTVVQNERKDDLRNAFKLLKVKAIFLSTKHFNCC